MKKGISLHTNNRPFYTKQVIEGLKTNDRLSDYSLYISSEPNPEQLQEIYYSYDIEHFLNINPTPLGCMNNSFKSVEMAFVDGCEVVVMLEDDDVPSLDMLDLVEFYIDQKPKKDVLCMCLFSNNEDSNADNSLIYTNEEFRTWGLVITKIQWDLYFKKTWKVESNSLGNHGWDWNMIALQKDLGLKIWKPLVSRIKNIGEQGINYNPGLYKAHRVDKVYFNQTKPKEYKLFNNTNFISIY